MKTTDFLLLVSASLILLGGCDVGDSATGGAASLESEAAQITGPLSLDLNDPEKFSELPGDYTVAMDYRFIVLNEDGTQIESTWRLDGVGRADPPASRYTFTGSGAANIEGSGVFEATYIGNQSYFYTSQMGCVSMSADATTSPFSTMVDTGGMLANKVQRVLPDEAINGVPAYHFAITQQNLDLADPTSMEIREFTGGSIYVAKEGGYVLRLQMQGRGISSLLTSDESLEGEIIYQLDFTPVPSVGEITPPDGCAGATESEFPVMADATNLASFEGFLSYQTPSPLEAVLDFYRNEMADAGWTLSEENALANIATLRFENADRLVSVVITFDSGTGISSVIIGEEQP